MKSLVIYFSKFGNTKMVAEAITEVLASAGQVRAIPTDQLEDADLRDLDLVVMGSPTHRMNLPQAVRPVFGRLPKRSFLNARVAAFDTSYKMSAFLARSTAAPKLLRKLRRLGERLWLRRRPSMSWNRKVRSLRARSSGRKPGPESSSRNSTSWPAIKGTACGRYASPWSTHSGVASKPALPAHLR
jgi:flavodoxin